jgi:hypothetical protein
MAQHDYIIDNGTGAAVRSDLNDALAAIVSQNSGAAEPTTTYAYMLWADTSAGVLKLRNGANNAWITLRQLDGDFDTVPVENGSNSAPSIYFRASGTDTGFYSSGTDALDFTTAGTRRLGISSGGDITVYGGNTTLNAQGDLRFADSDSSNWVAFQAPATVSSNVTWTLPAADGTTGQILSTDGSGTLSWASAAGTSDKISEGNTEAEVVDTGVDGHFKVTTEGTERLRIDASGRVLVGTATARTAWNNTTIGANIFQVERAGDSASTAISICANPGTSATETARLLLGRTRGNTLGATTVVASGDALGLVSFQGSDGTEMVEAAEIAAFVDGTPGANDMPGRLTFSTTPDGSATLSERMRIDSSGRVLVGTSSAQSGTRSQYSKFTVQGNNQSTSDGAQVNLANNTNAPSLNTGDTLGQIIFTDNGPGEYGKIACQMDGAGAGSGDYPGRLVFSTTADGASSPTERMRIDSNGAVTLGANATTGSYFAAKTSSATVAYFDRTTNDGNVIEIRQDGTTEGAISVSGSTVTYGGGHLARWSQLPNNEDPSGLLKGTVMSNLDEMCEWGEEDNEQLNKTKVSDVEGDSNVAGVFVSTSPDEVGPLDYWLAMTGDMIIRIAEGVTVQRGDLLMSAGDGTAKPQDDDIIRSKTVAKVTSTHVTCTYDDGSYCVPCVLMAC